MSRGGGRPPTRGAGRGDAPSRAAAPRVGQHGSLHTERAPGKHYGIARILSKRGVCSRTEAAEWVRNGRVRLGAKVIRDPEYPTSPDRDDIFIDGAPLAAAAPLVLMLNKPRGLVTTARDERGRDTVYRCFDDARLEGQPLPWLAPVGRLDKASEGLLLFSNDPVWAAGVTDPVTGPSKTYRVQVDGIPSPELLTALCAGTEVEIEDRRLHIAAAAASLLGAGTRNAWLEITLDEGRNRQIRRLLQAFGLETLRLMRVAIGGLVLGDLPKGAWRPLGPEDLALLTTGMPSDPV